MASPSQPGRTCGGRPHRHDVRGRAAGCAGSGLCGVVDAGAARARSAVRAASRARRSTCRWRARSPSSVGIAEIVLLERKRGRLDARWRSASCRSMRSPAPKPGLLVPGGSEGFAAGAPVDAYMLRE